MTELSKAGSARHAMNDGRIDYLDMVIQDTREYLSELSAVAHEFRVCHKTLKEQGNDEGAMKYFRLWKRTEGQLAESKRYLSMFERTKAGYVMENNRND